MADGDELSPQSSQACSQVPTGISMLGGTRSDLCCHLFFVLAILCVLQDLSSPARDRTHAPCLGSVESQPLDHQGGPPPPS